MNFFFGADTTPSLPLQVHLYVFLIVIQIYSSVLKQPHAHHSIGYVSCILFEATNNLFFKTKLKDSACFN